MENILVDDREAEKLWEEFAFPSHDFIEDVRHEVACFLKYTKDREFDERIKKAKPKNDC